MPPTVVYYGRRSTTPEGDYGTVGDGVETAVTFNAASQDLWAYTFEARIGKATGTNVTGRYGCWLGNSSKEPDDRYGYSAQWTASTSMTTWDGGALVSANVALADYAPSNTAIQLWNGNRYSLGFLPDGASLGFGMRQAAFITADDERLFKRNGVAGSTPTDPFGSLSSASVEGHITIWLECHTNEAPRVPVNRTPSGDIDTLTPTFEGDFRDRNGTWGPGNDGFDDGDELKRYQIQVRRVSDGVLMWNPAAINAGSVQKANDRFSKVYEGSTLVRGTAYEWRCRVQDMFETWGDWSDWLTFTPTDVGFVTLDGDPTGKQEVITGLDFDGKWTHNTGLSTNAVEVRLKQNGVVVQTSGTITKTVASSASPGTAFTVTWADTGFTDLEWGGSYTYEMRGRDTGNVWSAWSSGRSFNTNAAPTVPSSLSPTNSQVLTSFPLLRCLATDADTDDQFANLTVKARIKNSSGTVLFTRTMSWNAVTEQYEYQTDGTDLASFATYKWDAYSYDGTVYSGGTTVEANATASTEAVFIYADGPDVTITSPTEEQVLTTVTHTVSWSVTGTQTKYQIKVYADGTSELVYDSGLTVSTATSHAIPSGYLHNTTAYDLVVEITDNLALVGYSETRNFSIALTPPAAITNFQAVPVKIGYDAVESAVKLIWDQTSESVSDFIEYTIERSDLTTPYARITSPTQTTVTDYFPVSGTAYTWTIRQVALRDAEEVESDEVTAETSIELEGVVLNSVTNPGTHHVNLSYGEDRSHTRTGEETFYLPWGSDKPVTFRGLVNFWTTDARYFLITDSRTGVTALQHLAALEALEDYGGVFCYRDERGRKRFVVIVRDGLTVYDVFPQRADVELSLREEAYTEGVS